MEYYNRLRNVREDKDLSRDTVAKAIGTTQQQLYKYEKGEQIMTIGRLTALCAYYQVSADYILGLPRGLDWPR